MALTERSLVTVRAVLPSLARNARRPPFPAGRFPGRSPAPAPPGGQRQERRQQRQRGAGRAAPPRTDLPDTTTHTECHGSHGTCPKRDRHHRQIRRIEMQANSQDLSKICQRGSQRSTRRQARPGLRASRRQTACAANGQSGSGLQIYSQIRHRASRNPSARQYDRATSPAPRAHSSTMIKFILRILVVAIVSFFVAYFMVDRSLNYFFRPQIEASPCARCAANCMPCTRNWMPSRRRTGRASSTRRSRRCMAPTSTCCPRNRSGWATRSGTSSPAWAWSFAKTTASTSSPARRAGAMAAGTPARRQSGRQAAGVERLAAPEPDRGHRPVPAVGLADLARPERAAQRHAADGPGRPGLLISMQS